MEDCSMCAYAAPFGEGGMVERYLGHFPYAGLDDDYWDRWMDAFSEKESAE